MYLVIVFAPCSYAQVGYAPFENVRIQHPLTCPCSQLARLRLVADMAMHMELDSTVQWQHAASGCQCRASRSLHRHSSSHVDHRFQNAHASLHAWGTWCSWQLGLVVWGSTSARALAHSLMLRSSLSRLSPLPLRVPTCLHPRIVTRRSST
jgi:hypothetical protein